MTQIKLRRDTAANWTSVNPVLGSGEPGFEIDTNRMKVGDGSTSWNNLDYFNSGSNRNIGEIFYSIVPVTDSF